MRHAAQTLCGVVTVLGVCLAVSLSAGEPTGRSALRAPQAPVDESDDKLVETSRNSPFPDGSVAGGVSGPDVIVGVLPSMGSQGTVSGISAFSVGTTSCNTGDQELLWLAGTNRVPVIAQNMYRLKDNRFEHIGMSWVKHAFCAL